MARVDSQPRCSALLYDVHGNLPALEAVLDDAQAAARRRAGCSAATTRCSAAGPRRRSRCCARCRTRRGSAATASAGRPHRGDAPDDPVVQGAIASARGDPRPARRGGPRRAARERADRRGDPRLARLAGERRALLPPRAAGARTPSCSPASPSTGSSSATRTSPSSASPTRPASSSSTRGASACRSTATRAPSWALIDDDGARRAPPRALRPRRRRPAACARSPARTAGARSSRSASSARSSSSASTSPARTSGRTSAAARSAMSSWRAGSAIGSGVDVLVRDQRQQVADAVQPRAPLVVGVDDVPRRLLDVGVAEHLVLGARVLDPALARLEVHRAELPAAHRVGDARLEAALLLLVADREPVLHEDDPRAHEHPLELRARAHELLVLLVGAEAHDALDAGAVVPAAVEQDHLAGGGQMRRRSAGSTTASSRARSACPSATVRHQRGFRRSVIRLITPPLPAASRPSKITTTRWPGLADVLLLDDELALQALELLVEGLAIET